MPGAKNILLIAMAMIIALLAGVIIGSRRLPQKVTIFNAPADKTSSSTKTVPDDVAGVYEYEFVGLVKGLDLRKDGTGITYQRQKYSTAQYGRQSFTWRMVDGAISINGKRLTMDGGDLIDSSNARWTRLRY